MKFNKIRAFSILLVITCVLINNYSLVFAQSSGPDTSKELSEVNNSGTVDNHSGCSKGIIDTLISTDTNSLNNNDQSASVNSSAPVGVVVNTVHAIGSGLVDLDIEITASMGITSVYGGMWYESTAGRRTALLERQQNGNVPYFYDSAQFIESPGTVIWTCASSGVVIFNFAYTYSFTSVPTDFIAIVF
jgi:hypothetical protein